MLHGLILSTDTILMGRRLPEGGHCTSSMLGQKRDSWPGVDPANTKKPTSDGAHGAMLILSNRIRKRQRQPELFQFQRPIASERADLATHPAGEEPTIRGIVTGRVVTLAVPIA